MAIESKEAEAEAHTSTETTTQKDAEIIAITVASAVQGLHNGKDLGGRDRGPFRVIVAETTPIVTDLEATLHLLAAMKTSRTTERDTMNDLGDTKQRLEEVL